MVGMGRKRGERRAGEGERMGLERCQEKTGDRETGGETRGREDGKGIRGKREEGYIVKGK